MNNKEEAVFLDKGIYSIGDIRHLTGLSSQKIRRWSKGYSYTRNEIKHELEPVFKPDYENIDSTICFSFLDFIELLFIESFEKYKISLQSIRKASFEGAKILGTSHPFAKKVFYTDGKTILARIASNNKDAELIDLLSKQYEIDEIVEPCLSKCIDFDKYDYAERYWPEGRDVPIVIDPKVNFGKPTLTKNRMPTEVIQEMIDNGHDLVEISEWYQIDIELIHYAVRFENRKIA